MDRSVDRSTTMSFVFCCFSAISDSSDLTICCKLFELQVAGIMPMLKFKLSSIRRIRPSALSAVFRCKWCNWSVNVHWLRSVGNSLTLAYWFELRDTSEDHGWYWCEFREPDEEEEWLATPELVAVIRYRWQWFGSGWRQWESRGIRRRKKRGLGKDFQKLSVDQARVLCFWALGWGTSSVFALCFHRGCKFIVHSF